MVERLIGRHTICFEPPVLIHIILRGDVTPEDAAELAAFVREQGREAPFLISLNDLHEFGDIGAEARKVAGRAAVGLPFHAVAFIGGGFRQRLVTRMALAALQLFSPSLRGMKIGVFDAEAAARHWLAERAREGAASGKGGR